MAAGEKLMAECKTLGRCTKGETKIASGHNLQAERKLIFGRF